MGRDRLYTAQLGPSPVPSADTLGAGGSALRAPVRPCPLKPLRNPVTRRKWPTQEEVAAGNRKGEIWAVELAFQASCPDRKSGGMDWALEGRGGFQNKGGAE